LQTWIQYIEYVETLKIFIRAERIGDLNLHAVGKMLNLFAATGHSNHVKSARLYLQLMIQLPSGYTDALFKKDITPSAQAVDFGQACGLI